MPAVLPLPFGPSHTACAKTPKIFVLIACAGKGLRATNPSTHSSWPKQYQTLQGESVVWHTLRAFVQLPTIAKIFVVIHPEDELWQTQIDPTLGGLYPAQPGSLYPNTSVGKEQNTPLEESTASPPSFPPIEAIACGGETRASSVLNGLFALRERGVEQDDWVLVHDAARCLVQPSDIQNLIGLCLQDEVGGLLACPVPDSLHKEVQGRAQLSLSRNGLWLAQTPQMFRWGPLCQALQQPPPAHLPQGWTDEASAMQAMGHLPRLVPSSVQNLKITYPTDFELAQALLAQRANPSSVVKTPPSNTFMLPPTTPVPNAQTLHQEEKVLGEVSPSARGNSPSSFFQGTGLPMLRIGEGWDSHALVPGRKLVLGGTHVPFEKGLLGHSDADVLLHAITDALLGACGLGNIGEHFPDNDPALQGCDSWDLLQQAAKLASAQGFWVMNVDSTIIAQAPKLAPYLPTMRERVAAALGVAVHQVNVKAKTAEKLGPVGEGQSMEARAVVLVGQTCC